MPYITDPVKLNEELEGFNGSVAKLAQELTQGSITEPQTMTVEPPFLGRLRLLLYSVLHSAGIKDHFRLKVLSPNQLMLEPRRKKKGRAQWIQVQPDVWNPEATSETASSLKVKNDYIVSIDNYSPLL